MVLETSTLPTELYPYVPKYYIILSVKCQVFLRIFLKVVKNSVIICVFIRKKGDRAQYFPTFGKY